jgi:hypothetical protein
VTDRRSWGRSDFADFARWFVAWLEDGRPCRCFVNRGERGHLAFFDLQPARAWVQHSSRTLNDEPELTELFVEWTPGTEVTMERKHFRTAIARDDAEVVVELFAKPHVIMRFIRP